MDRVLVYNGVSYFRNDDHWIENEVKIMFGRLQPPTRASEEINGILDRIYFREDKLKRILEEEIRKGY